MLAIILSRRDFRENDQIITFYTKERGLVSALARGVKKSVSKNAAALEPLSYVEVELVPGKELQHVTQVHTIEYFPLIRQNLAKISFGRYAVELLGTVLTDEVPDILLFDILASFLHFLEKQENLSTLLLASFVLKVWSRLGFTPVLNRCIHCDKAVAENETCYFDVAAGGVSHEQCALAVLSSSANRIIFNTLTRRNFSMLLHGSWAEVGALEAPESTSTQLHTAVFQFALYHGSHKIKDWQAIAYII